MAFSQTPCLQEPIHLSRLTAANESYSDETNFILTSVRTLNYGNRKANSTLFTTIPDSPSKNERGNQERTNLPYFKSINFFVAMNLLEPSML